MDIIVASGLVYNDLKLAKNEIIINVDAIDPSITDRSQMRYYLELSVPVARNSSTYRVIATMDAAEQPLEQVGEAFVAAGAFFDIKKLLASFLCNTAPEFGQNQITSVASLVTTFKLKVTRKNGDTVVDVTDLPVQYAIYAGIRTDELSSWSEVFFSKYIGEKRGFLSWNPSARILPEQPAYLSFLTNMQPTPTELYLRVYRWYNDGTEDSTAESVSSIGDVEYMNVYQVPVGPLAAGVITDANAKATDKRCTSYMVWLVNEAGAIVSERKMFKIDWRYFRSKRFILFENSLGGWDSLAATGDYIDQLNVLQQDAERQRPYSATATFAERTVESVEGIRQIEITTDWINDAERKWLEDLAMSKNVVLVSDRDHIPLLRTAANYSKYDSRERAKQRKFYFQYSNIIENYSELPVAEFAETRATGWREYTSGGAGSCQLDSFGKRTGKKIIPLLEKYYLDDDSVVKPATIKANSPSTEGYIPPVVDASCATTPFTNTIYTAAGTYVRSNCAADRVGEAANITIAAGRWGSEDNQEDADTKALAEWQALNTQAYADNNGACVLPTLTGLRNKFWNYVSAAPGFGPTFNFDLAPEFTGIRANANFDSGNDQLSDMYAAAASGGIDDDKWVAEFNGYLKAAATASDLQIDMQASDGVRVWLDDVLILDSWRYLSGISTLRESAPVAVSANALYKLKIRYYHAIGFTGFIARWKWSGQAIQVIPDANLIYI